MNVIQPVWRVISLVSMAVALVFTTLALGSTDWREDDEPWLNIKTTYGMKNISAQREKSPPMIVNYIAVRLKTVQYIMC